MPVTNNEYLLPDGVMQVTSTDMNGVITFCERNFIEASGYLEKELLGQPHNLVRHPDMPVEVFQDMWTQLKSGKAWTGVVKNRRKNGDYYWILANMTPLHEGGAVTGYMSVRSKPSREQITAAETDYRHLREGLAKGMRIESGKIVREHAFSAVRRQLNRLSVGQRLMAGFGSMLILLSIIGGNAYVVAGFCCKLRGGRCRRPA